MSQLEGGFYKVTTDKFGKKKKKYIVRCTIAEQNAIVAICEQYPPETPLAYVKRNILRGCELQAYFDSFINAGYNKVGDVLK